MPMLAMVAVDDTKPDATEDSITACRASSNRRLRCAKDWMTSSKASSCVIRWGFNTSPHSGWSGISGRAISTNAPRMMPSRTSPGCSQRLAKWCSRSRAASSAVSVTAMAAARGGVHTLSTPMR